jgi:hypothetical protein
MPVPDGVSADHDLTFSLPEKLFVISRVPFHLLSATLLTWTAFLAALNLDIGSDPLPLKTTHSGRVVYDPDAAV